MDTIQPRGQRYIQPGCNQNAGLGTLFAHHSGDLPAELDESSRGQIFFPDQQEVDSLSGKRGAAQRQRPQPSQSSPESEFALLRKRPSGQRAICDSETQHLTECKAVPSGARIHRLWHRIDLRRGGTRL
jgi:hypothetical protein